MKKSFARLLLVSTLVLSCFCIFPAHAVEDAPPEVVPSEISTRAEEIGYAYRITEDGVKQYRIWSYTYGKWKTDWINC